MKYETSHWSIFNIMARLFGLLTLLAALAFLISAILQFTGVLQATPSIDALGYLVVGIFCFGIGLAFLKVSPYRPELNGERQDFPDSPEPKVGWWTGRRKKSSEDPGEARRTQPFVRDTE